MMVRPWIFVVGSIWILSGFAMSAARAQSPQSDSSPASTTKATKNKDEEAIRKSAQDFSDAFAKGDAKDIAAMWAEHGEYQDDGNKLLRGRQAIEKAYTELFAEKSGGKLDVDVQSVRFLTP